MLNRSSDETRNEARREAVASHYLEGKNLREIGSLLGVHFSTVSRDLTVLRERWRERAEAAIKERAADELARIDHLEQVAWASWERSCQPAVTRRTQKAKGRVDKAGALLPDLDVAERTERDQVGNPRFLDRVGWCIQKRCEMLGILQPEVSGITTVTTVIGGVDLDAILGRKPGLPMGQPSEN